MAWWTASALALVGAIYIVWRAVKHNYPTGVISTHVWRPSHQDFVYPEVDARFGLKDYLQERDDFGIAFAGGGTRGMGFSHGAARALREAGILQRARYTTVTSGSAWFGIPLYYQQQDTVEEYLGTSMSPDQLTPEALTSSAAGSMISRLEFPVLKYPLPVGPKHDDESDVGMETPGWAEDFARLQQSDSSSISDITPEMISGMWQCLKNPCMCAVMVLVPNTSLEEMWQMVSAYLFLRPHGLAVRDAVYAEAPEAARVQNALDGSTHVFTTRDIKKDHLPFMVSQAAVFAPFTGTNVSENPLAAYPYENTPLYSGIVPRFAGDDAGPYGAFGDVLVEPFAARSEVVQGLPDEAMTDVQVKKRRVYFNSGGLADWAGITTAFIADYQLGDHWYDTFLKNGSYCLQAVAEKFLPHYPMWSPHLQQSNSIVPKTQAMPIGDAGVYDDLGHLPLLRRNVSKMIIFDTSAGHDTNSSAAGKADRGDIWEMSYLTAAFGQADLPLGTLPGSPNPNMPENYMTVFDPADFGKLWAEITRLYNAREPVIVRGNYTTVQNDHWGIVGGRKVEIVWILGMDVAEWRNALPTDTVNKLPSYFPNYKCWEAISQFQISAVSQLASWITQRALGEINAMLGPAPAKSSSSFAKTAFI